MAKFGMNLSEGYCNAIVVTPLCLGAGRLDRLLYAVVHVLLQF